LTLFSVNPQTRSQTFGGTPKGAGEDARDPQSFRIAPAWKWGGWRENGGGAKIFEYFT
jgi:hypothetical protein